MNLTTTKKEQFIKTMHTFYLDEVKDDGSHKLRHSR